MPAAFRSEADFPGAREMAAGAVRGMHAARSLIRDIGAGATATRINALAGLLPGTKTASPAPI